MSNIERIKQIPILEVANKLGIEVDKNNKAYCFKGHDKKSKSLSFNIDENYFNCFGCGIGGTTIDLVKEYLQINTGEAIKWLEDNFNIKSDFSSNGNKDNKIHAQTAKKALNSNVLDIKRNSVSEYKKLNYEALQELTEEAKEYLLSRGINQTTWDKAGLKIEGDYIAVPVKDLEGNIKTYYRRAYKNIEPRFLNPSRVNTFPLLFTENKDYESIIICEGIFDTLTLVECGKDKEYLIMGIAGVNNWKPDYKKYIENKQVIILADNDTAGQSFINSLENELNELAKNIYTLPGLLKSYNDINEAYVDLGKDEFLNLFDYALINAKSYIEKKYLNAGNIDILNRILDYKQPTSTGIKNIDVVLNGGFYPKSLVVLAGLSGSGKTTLILQIAGNIATAGTPVIFFSYEMSAVQLMAKMLSKRMNLTEQEILTGKDKEYNKSLSKDWLKSEHEILCNELIGNLWIIEADLNFNGVEIEKTVNNITRHHNKAPMVIIDYLQRIPSFNPKEDIRQRIANLSFYLRRISQHLDCSVIVISSINRASYKIIEKEKDNSELLACFKEAGEIEYTADVALLIAEDKGNRNLSIQNSKASFLKTIKFKVIKNRFGQTTETELVFNGKRAYFTG